MKSLYRVSIHTKQKKNESEHYDTRSTQSQCTENEKKETT